MISSKKNLFISQGFQKSPKSTKGKNFSGANRSVILTRIPKRHEAAVSRRAPTSPSKKTCAKPQNLVLDDDGQRRRGSSSPKSIISLQQSNRSGHSQQALTYDNLQSAKRSHKQQRNAGDDIPPPPPLVKVGSSEGGSSEGGWRSTSSGTGSSEDSGSERLVSNFKLYTWYSKEVDCQFGNY